MKAREEREAGVREQAIGFGETGGVEKEGQGVIMGWVVGAIMSGTEKLAENLRRRNHEEAKKHVGGKNREKKLPPFTPLKAQLVPL